MGDDSAGRDSDVSCFYDVARDSAVFQVGFQFARSDSLYVGNKRFNGTAVLLCILCNGQSDDGDFCGAIPSRSATSKNPKNPKVELMVKRDKASPALAKFNCNKSLTTVRGVLRLAKKVLMLENSIYSVISPEGCASILWRDGSQAQKAAEALGRMVEVHRVRHAFDAHGIRNVVIAAPRASHRVLKIVVACFRLDIIQRLAVRVAAARQYLSAQVFRHAENILHDGARVLKHTRVNALDDIAQLVAALRRHVHGILRFHPQAHCHL